MSYNYSEYINAISSLVVMPSSDNSFIGIIPRAIEYAEQRIYRELDLLQTVETEIVALSPSVRSVALPDGMIVLNAVNVITPAATAPDAGTRNSLQEVSVDYLNATWISAGVTYADSPVPQVFANLNNGSILLGPSPYAAYNAEFIGTFRPTPLSSTNTTTILTTYLPDLFIAASMIFMTGYQRDFGAQANDPQAAMSWEAQYGKLMQSAMVETQRIKSQGPGWQPESPAPIASGQRM